VDRVRATGVAKVIVVLRTRLQPNVRSSMVGEHQYKRGENRSSYLFLLLIAEIKY